MNRMLFITAFIALSLNATNIDIMTMPSNPERAYPSNDKMVLSYHNSIKKAKRSVVNISTTKEVVQNNQLNQMFNHPFFKDFFGEGFPDMQQGPQKRKASSLGSGVIISKDGYIVTNNHVVEGADEILVTLLDKSKEFEAKVVGFDPKSDLAVIKIDAKELQAASFGDSSNLREGDVVFAIGNPFGVGGSVTQGIVSALNKSGIGLNQYENFIQTDASINPGNSGGALVDSRGALIGINSAILSRSGGNNGIGFAIPSNMVKEIATSLVKDGKIERGYIGVSISDLKKDLKDIYDSDSGAFIVQVEPDSPAAKAGLQRGDLIVKVNNDAIKNANDLKNSIGNKAPGENVEVTYERDNALKTTQIKLDDMDKSVTLGSAQKTKIKGLQLEELNDTLKRKYQIPSRVTGVFISGVENNSEAAKLGFMPGDIIVQVNNDVITNIEELREAFQKNKKNTIVWINRNGVSTYIVIK